MIFDALKTRKSWCPEERSVGVGSIHMSPACILWRENTKTL